ncbi:MULTISPECIES: phage tail protein [unclassified Pseudomonas]|uniref:phage tail protein n=1 Tax=unclassified Pseudomonas TaxID=196821 RepID=UPI0008768403|nr:MULTISPECIES: phage tail protein [unclassified Pseudomonas]SCZ75903.1 Phage tail-collar fibre protein [Pseudomonas sp. NFPP17]SDA89928.1 Phage tail-collar fibre protein [Pseudomonas sp. NFPP15]SEL72892.1 Phage tail-collar fibre protein [Pseudomonas sp. NFPP18]SFA66364.1 Phage tail-collar fibre protein [Pseudomonas sp. NFPP13]SFU13199.1 Phage tail-collar fibre protein [Pseudomonas sp. NFPP25]
MIDSNSQFFAILTAVGEAKQANATALGVPWTFKEMVVGDANGTDPIPNRTQTKLINEWRRAPVNQVRTDPANPNIIITEQVIPSDVGGRWIREIGLFDADGDLVAVANCAPSFKPLLAQGTGKTQIIRMNFVVSNTAQIVLKIDPAVVLATRQYVDESLAAALPASKIPGTYRQVTIDKRGIVVSGANPTTLAGYGITDAFTKPETSAAINQAVAALVAASPGALDTLKELADALGNDPNFATTMTNALASKANKATTLGGYGITDGATKTELNSGLADYIKKGQVLNPGESLTCTSATTGTIAGTSSSAGGFEARANATAAAVLSFHRPGSFGVNFGLDTDNQLKVGGWSMGSVAHTIWHSGNRPRDTASLGPAGWSKNADTGEIVQWIEVPVNDFQHGRLINITWPFQFPTQFLHAVISFRQASSSGNFCGQAVYSAGTQTGCTLRMEEWAGVGQDGLVVIVTARGF